jgi:hypothetical protein
MNAGHGRAKVRKDGERRRREKQGNGQGCQKIMYIRIRFFTDISQKKRTRNPII